MLSNAAMCRSENVRAEVQELAGPDRTTRGERVGDEEGVHQAAREVGHPYPEYFYVIKRRHLLKKILKITF